MSVSRNEPCPCGSGKKYKKCCLNVKSAAESPSRFRFESGSYGGPGRQYMPSIISYEQITPEKWSEHFCLVNPVQCFDSGDKASALAEADLNDASAAKSDSGSDEDFAMSLKNKGYMKVDNFRRAVN
ncbi:MAG: SEC-C metal-binding domain-containing protein [Victivallaceae bacterium]